MAKYIKFDLTANDPSPELLIPLAAITYCERVSDTVTDVFLDINNAASTKWTITHTTIASLTAVTEAIQSAQKANPGGVVSTVVPPIVSAQNPAAQSGAQGRILIIDEPVYLSFTSAAFTA